MDVAARHRRLLALLAARGAVRVTALAADLGVSPVTARRDVEELARQGLLSRRHGEVSPVRTSAAGGGDLTGRTVVAVSTEVSPYVSEILLAARDVVVTGGGRFVLDVVPGPGEQQEALRRACADPSCVGALYVPLWRTPEQQAAACAVGEAVHGPVVVVERFPNRGSVLARRDAVRSDHASGVHQALAHLAGRGHRRVLVFTRDDTPTARTVRACAPDALRSLGLAVLSDPLLSATAADPQHRLPADDPVTAVRRHRATAVLVHNDADALTLVQRLRLAGLDVPRDVSVVAYDDVVAGLGDVRLTTVAPPKAEVGVAALDLLRWRAAHPRAAVRRVELGPHLVERDSVRPLDHR